MSQAYEAKEYSPSNPPTTKKKPTKKPVDPILQAFSTAIDLVSNVAEHRASLPILETAYFDGETLTATDLEQILTVNLPFNKCDPVCIPVDKIKKILRTQTELNFDIDYDAKYLEINGFRIGILDACEFPQNLGSTTFEQLGQCGIPDRLADVFRAASPDESRPNLHGVCFDFKEGAVVASDGHRCHVLTIPKVDLPTIIIHSESVKTILKLSNKQDILATLREFAPPILRVETPAFTYSSRTVDAEFPDWQRVIKDKRDYASITFNREAMLAAVNACLAICTERGRGIRFDYQEDPRQLTLSHLSPDLGEVRQVVPVSLTAHVQPPPKVFGLYADYLKDALSSFREEQVTMHLTKNDAPIHFTSENPEFQATIMALRVF